MCAGLTCEELILVELVLAVMLGPDTLVMCLIKWLVVSPGGRPLFFVAFSGLPLAGVALHTTQASERQLWVWCVLHTTMCSFNPAHAGKTTVAYGGRVYVIIVFFNIYVIA